MKTKLNVLVVPFPAFFKKKRDKFAVITYIAFPTSVAPRGPELTYICFSKSKLLDEIRESAKAYAEKRKNHPEFEVKTGAEYINSILQNKNPVPLPFKIQFDEEEFGNVTYAYFSKVLSFSFSVGKTDKLPNTTEILFFED